jgi:DNA (cytosine-5)-methyltransferase 1
MLRVFDFFSGCGGTSLGFQNFGFEIIGALDVDKDASNTFRLNFPHVHFAEKDIRSIAPRDLSEIINDTTKTGPLLFCGCAPCQPFTKQRRSIKEDDGRKTLLLEFLRFIVFWKPAYIFLENVPGLQKIDKSDGAYSTFTSTLKKLGYKFDASTVSASKLGVPQDRPRFILVGAKKSKNLRPITQIVKRYSAETLSIRDFIYDLPPIRAGETHPEIPNHAAANLSPQNFERIRLTPQGGDRRDWPENLKVGCHENYRGHSDVYGRMSWDKLASTLTTRCISYSNGRFGHPEQDRAISVREAARLQTFPDSFVFSGTLTSCARQVGNAVPPLMAQRMSEAFMLE